MPFKRVKSAADIDRELAAAKAAEQTRDAGLLRRLVRGLQGNGEVYFSPKCARSSADFVLLQADVTTNDDTDKDLMKRYRIVAPPDTLFFRRRWCGKRQLQLTGEENAAKFLKRVAAVRG